MVHYPRDELSRGLVGHWKLDDLKRVATDGIIAHYKMNDNAASTVVIDSKSGNNGVASANTDTLTTASGKIGRAFSFTNAEVIDISTNTVVDLRNRISISCWVKFDTLDTTGGFPTIFDSTGSSTKRGIILGFRNSDNRMFFELWNNGSPSLTLTTTKTDWSLATWYHIIVVWDSNLGSDNAQFYINGIVENSITDSGVSDGVGNAVDIGTNWEGDLDDVRIYDRALSLAEVQTIYNSGNGTETTELFRDTVTAIDRANFNDGTITGATNADGQNWKPSNSMSFDGVDDYVEIPHNANQLGANLSNGFTISAWINPKSIGEDGGRILDKTTAINAANGFTFKVSSAFKRVSFRINGGTEISSANNSVLFGIWYHVLITVSSAQIGSFYVNGVLSGTPADTVQTISTITTTNAPRIGNRATATDKTMDGIISKVKMWNRVLTKGEISKLYRLRK